jgi:hypothetical protein
MMMSYFFLRKFPVKTVILWDTTRPLELIMEELKNEKHGYVIKSIGLKNDMIFRIYQASSK